MSLYSTHFFFNSKKHLCSKSRNAVVLSHPKTFTGQPDFPHLTRDFDNFDTFSFGDEMGGGLQRLLQSIVGASLQPRRLYIEGARKVPRSRTIVLLKTCRLPVH
jgi:hypothetical protein